MTQTSIGNKEDKRTGNKTVEELKYGRECLPKKKVPERTVQRIPEKSGLAKKSNDVTRSMSRANELGQQI